MLSFRSLPITLLAALLVAGSDVTIDRFDCSLRRDSDINRQTATRDSGISGSGGKRDGWPFFEEKAALVTPSSSLPVTLPAVADPPVPAIPDFLGDIGGHKVLGPGGICDKNPLCSSFSAFLSSSVSAAVSSTVASADASILTATLSAISSSASDAVQSARDAGFRDGENQASESAQSAIDAARASASLISSVPKGEPQRLDRRGLNLDVRQLAGIIIGVFLSSSLLSILATLLLLRYRRQRTSTAKNTFNSSLKSTWPRPQPTLTNFWANILPFKHTGIGRAGHRQIPEQLSPAFTPGVVSPPSKHRRAMSSVDVPPFVSLISPGSPSDQPYPVSPPPDQPVHDPGERGHQRHGSQINKGTSVGFQQKGAPTKLPHQKDPVQHISQQAQKRDDENTIHQPQLGVRMSPNLSTGERSSNRIKGKAPLSPIAITNHSFPPIVPLRFSSLNAYSGTQAPNPIIGSPLHGEGYEVSSSLFPAGPESATRSHPFSPRDLLFPSLPLEPRPRGFQSPAAATPNNTDQRTQLQQPTSRFSMSPTPHSSVEYSLSISSSPPASHYGLQHQQEQPEMIIPLRPAPSSPSQLQLQSPVPRRPNIAANIVSLEPTSPRTP